MKTIPASWKITPQRGGWLNNIGTPIIAIKITGKKEVYRFANKYCIIDTDSYSDLWVLKFGNINMDCSYFESGLGIRGQVGDFSFSIGRFNKWNVDFLEYYDLSDFENAEVDIYLTFAEILNITSSDYIQIFKGIIADYEITPDLIKFKVKDISITKNKKFPERLDLFNQENSLGWDIPNAQKSKVVPIIFGNAKCKIEHCNTKKDLNGDVYLEYIAQIPKISQYDIVSSRIAYWDSSNKRFVYISPEKFSITNILDEKYRIFKIYPKDWSGIAEVTKYIRPYECVDYYQGHHPERINDQNLHNNQVGDDYAAFFWNSYCYQTWNKFYTIRFKKSDFEASDKFNLYLMIDVYIFEEDNFVHTPFRFTSATSDFDVINFPPSDWHKRETSKYDITTIESDYLSSTYPRFGSLKQITKNGESLLSIDDLPDELHFYIERYAKTNLGKNYIWEVAIKQVMAKIPYDLYADVTHLFTAGMGIKTGLQKLFEEVLNFSSNDYSIEGEFAYLKIDGAINEMTELFKVLDKWSNEFNFIWWIDEEGIIKIKEIENWQTVYTITDNDIILDEIILLEKEKANKEVYQEFVIDYNLNPATNEYEGGRNLNKDYSNFKWIDDSDLRTLCSNASLITDKTFSLRCDFIKDDQTAERVLSKIIQFFTSAKDLVKFKTTLRLIDLEIGDFIKFNTSVYQNENSFIIIAKRINLEDYTIEFEAIETIWTGSKELKVMSEDVEIEDSVKVLKGIKLDEEVQIEEDIVVHKEIPTGG